MEFENKESENAVYHYNPDFESDSDTGFDPDEYREESDYQYEPVKRTVHYDYTELTALEQYLENAEKQGLRLREFDRYKFYFEKCEPRIVRYACVVFKDENAPDGLNNEFVELCKGAGWTLAAFDKNIDELYIFRTSDKNADPIMTDDRQTLSFAARKNVRRNLFINLIYPVICMLSVAENIWFDVGLDATSLFKSVNILNIMLLMFWVLSISIPAAFFLDWYRKQKRRIEREERIEFLDIGRAEKRYKVMSVLYICGSVLMLGFSMFCDGGYFTKTMRIFDCSFFSLLISLYLHSAIKGKGFDLPIYKYRKRQALAVLSALCAFAAVSAVSILIGNSLPASVEDKLLTEEKALVSVSDFGCDKRRKEDSFDCDATRFFQMYTVKSDCTDDECKNDVWRIRYQIFVCDSPSMCNKYIESVLSDLPYDNMKKRSEPDNGWDGVYDFRYQDGETGKMKTCSQIAVRNNTVVYLDYIAESENESFFNLLYNRLFTDKKTDKNFEKTLDG